MLAYLLPNSTPSTSTPLGHSPPQCSKVSQIARTAPQATPTHSHTTVGVEKRKTTQTPAGNRDVCSPSDGLSDKPHRVAGTGPAQARPAFLTTSKRNTRGWQCSDKKSGEMLAYLLPNCTPSTCTPLGDSPPQCSEVPQIARTAPQATPRHSHTTVGVERSKTTETPTGTGEVGSPSDGLSENRSKSPEPARRRPGLPFL